MNSRFFKDLQLIFNPIPPGLFEGGAALGGGSFFLSFTERLLFVPGTSHMNMIQIL